MEQDVCPTDLHYLQSDQQQKKQRIGVTTPIIRFIHFEIFKNFGKFSRFPENEDLTCPLQLIDRNNSILIFISHCWLCPTSDNWAGRPHPDNENGDKHKLCVKGIERILEKLAPRMKDCYVWIDYGCINQDDKSQVSGALERYDKVVQCCDAIFTPIYDPDHMNWSFPSTIGSWFLDYKATAWNNGPKAYLNRGWCRVEMLYAANIPILENQCSTIKRHTMFEAGLAYHCSENRRPHFLYGNKEMFSTDMPGILPPLLNTYFEEYHPLQGNLTEASDAIHIEALIKELQPYIEARKIKVGYEGDFNDIGQKHGNGVMRYIIGDMYSGQWQNDVRSGYGVLLYANGNKYEGYFNNDLKEGQGKYSFANGNEHFGWYVNDEKNGPGVLKYANGNVFEGEYKNNRRHGACVTKNADGSVVYSVWNDGKLVQSFDK